MSYYRTKTYIAGDWDNDQEAIDFLYRSNQDDHYQLSFKDAHELRQAKDSSLNCSIKHSLRERLNASKTFVLIVGDNTDKARSGSCQYCSSKNTYTQTCAKGYSIDNRSYIEFECDYAANHQNELKIIVLYNSTEVNKFKCPESLRHIGKHIPMYTNVFGCKIPNIIAIERAIMN